MKYRYMRYPDFRDKAVTFSYDDGANADFRLVEILNRYGVKGTFNIPVSRLEQMDEKQLAMYYPNGHEIANHGEKHMAPIRSSDIDGLREVLFGRQGLERKFKRIIRGFAFPDKGQTNQTIESYLKMLGIAYARTARSSYSFDLPANFLEWNPTCKHTEECLGELCDRFLTEEPTEKYVSARTSMLFYLWGHSFEYERDDNWSILEGFCEKVAHNPKIWYATNMEIYECVKAYESLVFNTDNTLVYNPSLTEVFFEADGKNYSVKPGETLEIK